MPDLNWNRKWDQMIASFVPHDAESHWGDRWGDPDSFAPLLAVRREFITPNLRADQVVLEIGPGGGRMTQYLLAAREVVAVDYNPAAFDYLRQRFSGQLHKLRFYQTSGFELHGVASTSIDLAFTFDVFVHLESEGIAAYLQEISRVLKPAGRAIVHYGDINKPIARENPGFSRMTPELMLPLVQAAGLQVLRHDLEIMFHSNLLLLEKPL
jgi:SAM-dependent methyltransferase